MWQISGNPTSKPCAVYIILPCGTVLKAIPHRGHIHTYLWEHRQQDNVTYPLVIQRGIWQILCK